MHCLPDHQIQVIPLHNQIIIPVHPQVLKHHIHILLNAEKLFRQLRVLLLARLLQQQPHGCDGCLNLMDPHGIVFRHLFPGSLGQAAYTLPVPAKEHEEMLVFLF